MLPEKACTAAATGVWFLLAAGVYAEMLYHVASLPGLFTSPVDALAGTLSGGAGPTI